MSFSIKVVGLDKVMNDFTTKGIEAQLRADRITETYTRKMANESGAMAPVDSSDLQKNIIASPRKVSESTWEYGGTLPYARRQEYEHKTKKGFIRKALWNNRTPYREAIKREVTRK